MRHEGIKVGHKYTDINSYGGSHVIYTVTDKSEKYFWLTWDGYEKHTTLINKMSGYETHGSRVPLNYAEKLVEYFEPAKPVLPREYDIVWAKGGVNQTGGIVATFVPAGFGVSSRELYRERIVFDPSKVTPPS